jgi:NAD(P)H-nitrite reductase large subunit
LLDLEDGRRLQYDRLLIATGAQAQAGPFPGANLAGVFKLDTLADTRRILQACGWFKSAVVVGGGITALELAEGLRTRGMRTHYLLRGKRYWSDVLDEVESSIVLRRLQHEGVRLHLETQVQQAIGKAGRIMAVETQTGEQIPCSLLAVAIGVRPRLDLARQAGLLIDRGIVVNEYLQTSSADIFAAGDCAQVRDPITGRAALDVLWPIALQQGACAGANMTGAAQAYIKNIPFNVTQLTGLKVTIIGAVGGGKNEDLLSVSRGESEAWRMVPRAAVVSRRDDVNRVRLLVDETRIVGALVMGDQTWSRPLQRLIGERVEISSIRAALLRGEGDALDQVATFYKLWERKCAKGNM